MWLDMDDQRQPGIVLPGQNISETLVNIVQRVPKDLEVLYAGFFVLHFQPSMRQTHMADRRSLPPYAGSVSFSMTPHLVLLTTNTRHER